MGNNMVAESSKRHDPSRPPKRPSNIVVPTPLAEHLGEDLCTHEKGENNPEQPSSPQEVELGVYLRASFSEAGSPRSPLGSASPSRPRFSSSRISVTHSHLPKSFFLSNAQWRTDIVTFCSHARADSALGQARITHIQARKSRRPPFMHEYLLVFCTATQGQHFVVRIDRLGKVGSPSSGGLLGWCAGQRVAANTAIQEVGVFHLEGSRAQVDALDGPWLSNDGRWGSFPVATLVTWESARELSGQVSHHVQTASTQRGPSPRLSDVSRLLEAILLEMPTYHLVTTNCYFMTRSSLLLLQRCFPTSFACYLGSASGELVRHSELAEPVWAGLLRWYLPFVIAVFIIYLPAVIFTQVILAGTTKGGGFADSLRISAHAIIDIPLPVGLLHAWITSLEVRMNDLVLRIATEYQGILAREDPERALLGDQQPFGVPSTEPWHVLAVWYILAVTYTLVPFLVLALKTTGFLITFFTMLAFAIAFNIKFFGNDILEDPFAVDSPATEPPLDVDLPSIARGDPILGT
ncbi:hypothetical protein BDV93DRAFT_547870 [Ceratobasidium sp. AG-I]|nr:hypothetical protein BDV93DRAFT_547870 [Ceratobasidium sp. AG-I]